VRRVVLRIGGMSIDADDLTHEVFLIALRKWARMPRDTDARAWLYGVAVRQVWAARARVEMVTRLTGSSRVALLLTGPGTHSAREVAHALGVPVAAVLPDDSRAAALLSDGAGSQRYLSSGALLRSARSAGRALRDHVEVMTPEPTGAGAVT